MTQQYQEESINGQPSPLSLRVNPRAIPAPGGVSTEAIWWPTLAADAVIEGDGISVAGNAADGSIIEISQPGLYEAKLWMSDDTPGPNPINILRGVAVDITAGNGYPVIDWPFAASFGLEGLLWTPDSVTGPISNFVSATFRITGTDLANVGTNDTVNPNRQIRFSADAVVIPALLHPFTMIQIDRVSL